MGNIQNKIESSKIPSEWHLWIHFLTKINLTNNINKFSFGKKNIQENITGTKKAYKPEGSLSF